MTELIERASLAHPTGCLQPQTFHMEPPQIASYGGAVRLFRYDEHETMNNNMDLPIAAFCRFLLHPSLSFFLAALRITASLLIDDRSAEHFMAGGPIIPPTSVAFDKGPN